MQVVEGEKWFFTLTRLENELLECKNNMIHNSFITREDFKELKQVNSFCCQKQCLSVSLQFFDVLILKLNFKN